MEWNVLFLIPILFGLFLVVKLLYNPLGFLARILGCALTGTVLVAVCNVVLGLVGLHIAFNLFSILVAGILHLPGLILLLILSQWLV